MNALIADMTALRTPAKRVTYPDTFASPDQTRAQFDSSYDLEPAIREQEALARGTTPQSVDTDYAEVVRCHAYNDVSTHLSGHPDEVLSGWPANDIRIEQAPPPHIPAAAKRFAILFRVLLLHCAVCSRVFVCVSVRGCCMCI